MAYISLTGSLFFALSGLQRCAHPDLRAALFGGDENSAIFAKGGLRDARPSRLVVMQTGWFLISASEQ